MGNSFDIGLIIFISLPLVGMVALYAWLWRGRMLLGKPVGYRLEEHRRLLLSSIKPALPVMGLLIMLMAVPILDLCNVSRTWHMFWTGVIIASDIWLSSVAISNALTRLRREQAERNARRKPDMAG